MTACPEVVLISMPFGPLGQPSLGLSLLKAGLTHRDVRIRYPTFAFAELVGPELYTWIAEGSPDSTCLLGEWLFAPGLSAPGPGSEERYRREVIGSRISDDAWVALLRARSLVTGFLDAQARAVVELRPRIVGLSSLFQQHAASLGLARRIKEARPETVVVMGGANCEGVMGLQTVRSFPWVGAVVSGEADLVFPELVERVLGGASLEGRPGVYGRDSGGGAEVESAPRVENLDALPEPDFSDFLDAWRASPCSEGRIPRLLLETARGCWWGEKQHCIFCGLNGAAMSYRSKSPERARREIENAARLGVRDILMVDNILDMKHLREMLPGLASAGFSGRLFYETKSNLRREHLEVMREAGVREIQPGIESLSDSVLSLMRKGVRGIQNVQLLRRCRELGIWPHWNLLWGFPGEPPEDYARMEVVLPWLVHLPPPDGAAALRLDRFSPCFMDAEAMGLTGVRATSAYRHVYSLPDTELDRLAYFFDYEHADGRNVADYTAGLATQVESWRRVHSTSSLTALEREAETLVLDRRPAARRQIHRLTGLSRELYQRCDVVRTEAELRRECTSSDGSVSEVLAALVDEGLVYRDGERCLALGIDAGT